MKRNTTPTLEVKIKMPIEKVKRLEFIFKEEQGENYPALLRKEFDREEIPIKESSENSCFVVMLSFSAEETMKIPNGEVYMDTRIVLEGNIVPPTSICCFNMRGTLFDDVFEAKSEETSGGEQQ